MPTVACWTVCLAQPAMLLRYLLACFTSCSSLTLERVRTHVRGVRAKKNNLVPLAIE